MVTTPFEVVLVVVGTAWTEQNVELVTEVGGLLPTVVVVVDGSGRRQRRIVSSILAWHGWIFCRLEPCLKLGTFIGPVDGDSEPQSRSPGAEWSRRTKGDDGSQGKTSTAWVAWIRGYLLLRIQLL